MNIYAFVIVLYGMTLFTILLVILPITSPSGARLANRLVEAVIDLLKWRKR